MGATSHNDRVRIHKDNAVKHLGEMESAIEKGDFELAMHHHKVANIAIDEMVAVSRMTEGKP